MGLRAAIRSVVLVCAVALCGCREEAPLFGPPLTEFGDRSACPPMSADVNAAAWIWAWPSEIGNIAIGTADVRPDVNAFPVAPREECDAEPGDRWFVTVDVELGSNGATPIGIHSAMLLRREADGNCLRITTDGFAAPTPRLEILAFDEEAICGELRYDEPEASGPFVDVDFVARWHVEHR